MYRNNELIKVTLVMGVKQRKSLYTNSIYQKIVLGTTRRETLILNDILLGLIRL